MCFSKNITHFLRPQSKISIEEIERPTCYSFFIIILNACPSMASAGLHKDTFELRRISGEIQGGSELGRYRLLHVCNHVWMHQHSFRPSLVFSPPGHELKAGGVGSINQNTGNNAIVKVDDKKPIQLYVYTCCDWIKHPQPTAQNLAVLAKIDAL